jgi:predicted nuclease of predicted toxin-antitoxin system
VSRQARSEEDWFEFDPPDFALGQKPRKLRLYADHNFPLQIVEELRAAGIPVRTAADDGRASHDDSAVYARARKLGLVLLTLDGDFWDDRRHSLQKGPGVIFVDLPPEKASAIVEGLALFYVTVAKYLSLDWWPGMKARIKRQTFTMKMHSYVGNIAEYEVRPERGRLLVREIRPLPGSYE